MYEQKSHPMVELVVSSIVKKTFWTEIFPKRAEFRWDVDAWILNDLTLSSAIHKESCWTPQVGDGRASSPRQNGTFAMTIWSSKPILFVYPFQWYWDHFKDNADNLRNYAHETIALYLEFPKIRVISLFFAFLG